MVNSIGLSLVDSVFSPPSFFFFFSHDFHVVGPRPTEDIVSAIFQNGSPRRLNIHEKLGARVHASRGAAEAVHWIRAANCSHVEKPARAAFTVTIAALGITCTTTLKRGRKVPAALVCVECSKTYVSVNGCEREQRRTTCL